MAAVPLIGGEVGADISIPAIGFGLAEGVAAYVAENPVTARKIEMRNKTTLLYLVVGTAGRLM